jgi:SWI/SNF-related matrix-associated actin-dependent regulator 1 of chromatin subfamily A
MKLDYNPSGGYYLIRVPRSESMAISQMMTEHGLSFSQSASTANEAVLFTKEPYAACWFAGDATPRAIKELGPILSAVNASWKAESNAHIKCPMDEELWPFQRADVEYALGRNNTLVGDQPGLGKTPVAICFANEIAAKRVLVICPANIRIQWVNRIRQWSTMRWPYIVYPILSGRHGVHPQAHWSVVSYDLAGTETIGGALAQGTYDLVILDEAHYLKSLDTRRTHAAFGDHTGWCQEYNKDDKTWRRLFPALTKRCGAIMALTGTPLPNRPREAYTLARNLCFESIDWMSEDTFKNRFNPSATMTGKRKDGTEYTYVREEVGRASELQSRLRANFMVRHLKKDVMTQLKLPIYDIVRVEETKPIKDALQAEGLLDIDLDRLEEEGIPVNGMWAEVRHAIGLAIAPQVVEYAEMCLDGGEDKLLIGAWHVDVLNYLEHKLQKYGTVRIDGSTSMKQREHRKEQFIENPKIRIILGNLMALGVGVDGLQQVCSHCLVAEPDPVPGNNEQFIDRLDRGGQARTVQADLFVAPGSLLERILAGALRKRHNTHKALDRRAA